MRFVRNHHQSKNLKNTSDTLNKLSCSFDIRHTLSKIKNKTNHCIKRVIIYVKQKELYYISLFCYVLARWFSKLVALTNDFWKVYSNYISINHKPTVIRFYLRATNCIIPCVTSVIYFLHVKPHISQLHLSITIMSFL